MGADYKIQNQASISFQSNGALPAAGFARFHGQCLSTANEIHAHIIAPANGIILGIVAYCENPPGAGESNTYHVRLNGADTPLNTVIAGAVDQYGENFAAPQAFQRGDRIALRCVATNLGAYVAGNHSESLLVKYY